MKISELVKKLNDAAKKMEKDGASYEVKEELQPGRGEGNYKFVFHAKKKGGFGLLKTIANVASGALYGGVEGAFWRAIGEVERREYRKTMGLIEREFKGNEIAAILRRWAETIPKGFIETIGSDLLLPKDPSWISATIKPGKEIKLVIDYAKLRAEAEAQEAISEVEKKAQEHLERAASYVEEAAKKAAESFAPPIAPIPPAAANMIPAAANQLYAPGSLSNTDRGFQLVLDNQFIDVGIVSPLKIKVDGVEIDSDKVQIEVGGRSIKSSEISLSNPLVFKKGESMRIVGEGITLPKGPHRIDIQTNIQGYGTINITITDQI
ncbi:MAG: hypothetical protein ACP6IP_02915 [Candidatus Njordarchaeia archaeon]